MNSQEAFEKWMENSAGTQSMLKLIDPLFREITTEALRLAFQAGECYRLEIELENLREANR